MKETTVRILCPNGIHISPAGVMAKLLRPLSAKVEIVRGEARANAADIDEVLALALREGEEVTVRADGGDACGKGQRCSRIFARRRRRQERRKMLPLIAVSR